jgi:hypothetical protein
MIGRLPESWIPPDHILDLTAAQTSGADLSVLAFTGSPDPALEMHWLGP